MRISCNGCRVLRKGCSKDCSIRPCLEWITSPKSQANATLFLAKFYGRAGLLNLINAGPVHLRPCIFKSLLQEACGRIVNPISGSSGLISINSWHLCQAAVEAVLNGSPITQVSLESSVDDTNSLFKACDIRHVSKQAKPSSRGSHEIKNRIRFKRQSAAKPKDEPAESSGNDSVSHVSDGVSIESTLEDTLVNGPSDVGPELNLGLSLFPILGAPKAEMIKEEENEEEVDGCDEATWKCDLTLGLQL